MPFLPAFFRPPLIFPVLYAVTYKNGNLPIFVSSRPLLALFGSLCLRCPIGNEGNQYYSGTLYSGHRNTLWYNSTPHCRQTWE
jgi:hypothetical protein